MSPCIATFYGRCSLDVCFIPRYKKACKAKPWAQLTDYTDYKLSRAALRLWSSPVSTYGFEVLYKSNNLRLLLWVHLFKSKYYSTKYRHTLQWDNMIINVLVLEIKLKSLVLGCVAHHQKKHLHLPQFLSLWYIINQFCYIQDLFAWLNLWIELLFMNTISLYFT